MKLWKAIAMDDRTRGRFEAIERALGTMGKKPVTNGEQRRMLIANVKNGLYQEEDLEESNYFRINLTQSLLVFYREVKKKNPEVASWMLKSYHEDHPSAEGSKLIHKFFSSIEASITVKQALKSAGGNREIAFLTTKESYRAGMGFLSSFMGWLYPMYQVWKDQTPDWKSLKWPDAKKADEFERISEGKDGLFYMLQPLVNKHLRNAIAHGDVHLDSENDKILYSNLIEGKIVHNEMSLEEFAAYGLYVFSMLPSIYIGALSAIFIYEHGQIEDKLKLPAICVEKLSGVNIEDIK